MLQKQTGSRRGDAAVRTGARLPEVGAARAGHRRQLADPGLLEDQLSVPEDLAGETARAVLQRRRLCRSGARWHVTGVCLLRPDAGRDLLHSGRAPRGTSQVRAGRTRLRAVSRCRIDDARCAGRDGALGRYPIYRSPGGRSAHVPHRARESDEGSLGRLVRHRKLRQADPHGERDRFRHRRVETRRAANSIPRRTSPAPATSWRIWCWLTRRRCTT